MSVEEWSNWNLNPVEPKNTSRRKWVARILSFLFDFNFWKMTDSGISSVNQISLISFSLSFKIANQVELTFYQLSTHQDLLINIFNCCIIWHPTKNNFYWSQLLFYSIDLFKFKGVFWVVELKLCYFTVTSWTPAP